MKVRIYFSNPSFTLFITTSAVQPITFTGGYKIPVFCENYRIGKIIIFLAFKNIRNIITLGIKFHYPYRLPGITP
jgi:hypothetical protein